MRRRDFITLLGAAAVARPMAARAQRPPLPVVGFLNSGSSAEFAHLVAAFNQGLNDAGFIEGQNVAIDYRWAQGQYARLPELVADLIDRKVAVIAASGGTSSALAAKAATATIPIVFVGGGDPVADGLVGSLNRPAANVTGMTVFSAVLGVKRLELLRELVPGGTVVGMLVNPTGKISEQDLVQAAADNVGQQIRMLNVSNDRELDAAFATILKKGIGGLLVTGDPFFTSRRDQLVLLTTRQGIPTVFPWREYVIGGGLLSYGTSLRNSYREMAGYVGRILKGAKTTDLPVQQPSKFELVLNLKAAKALAVTIPTSILLRADEVIE
jgi:putative tryptophan/tyrosine transport system substrate-binding protein